MAITGPEAAYLPLELERYVFELAATTHPATIPYLLRVAHRVLAWIEPLLYRVLCIIPARRIQEILAALKAKPAPFLASKVWHVLMYSTTPVPPTEAVESLLASCPGIIDLSVMVGVGPSLLPLLGQMHIQRLGIDLRDLFTDWAHALPDGSPINFGHPLFASVTHLDVFDTLYDVEQLEGIATLPVLTHLALNTSVDAAFLKQILEACTSLQVLIVAFNEEVVDDANALAMDITFVDPRLVVATYNEYFPDWELGARGGADIWRRADDFVARKRRGEIEAHEYLADSSQLDGSASKPKDGE
ncbi:hypothetical protein FB451DRAFT_758690 [Mycena latifolia]|nr:hypothetical protein FB451DRAFT_758690 [Mycena latifolia]